MRRGPCGVVVTVGNRFDYPVEPMTLGNMRVNGGCTLGQPCSKPNPARRFRLGRAALTVTPTEASADNCTEILPFGPLGVPTIGPRLASFIPSWS
jgi:hypothetical protein